jgi:hypothetical protein
VSVRIPSGPRVKSVSVDKEGVRTYRITFRVETDSILAGPNEIRLAPGLPRPGNVWTFETIPDFWVWCTQEREVTPVQKREGSSTYFWDVTCTFSSKAPKKCQDEKFEDPLLELPIISGGSVRYTEEATIDRFGKPIRNSAHEILKGHTIEFDANRPTIKIKMNVGTFSQISLAYRMQDHLNSVTLWGLGPRRIKLSGVDFEKKYFGLCHAYYELTLEFDVGNAQHGGRAGSTTFDRDIADEGTKVLIGHWDKLTGDWVVDTVGGAPADPSDPRHFIRITDVPGNVLKSIILDGAGKPFKPDRELVHHAPPANQCDQCDYAPQYWQVEGFDEFVEMNLQLSHVNATCRWTGSGTTLDSPHVIFNEELKYDTGRSIWVFTNDYFPGQEWVLDINDPTGIELECLGDNYMESRADPDAPVTAQSGFPSSILLTPGAGNVPGSIHVEKYPEANFLLLGIPAVL